MNHKTKLVILKKWYLSNPKPLGWIDNLTIEQREHLEQRIEKSKIFSYGEKIGFMSFFEIELKLAL